MTGRTYTSFRTQTCKERPFNLLKIGLRREREELYERINRRVDQMMEEGLLEEAKTRCPLQTSQFLKHRRLQGIIQVS